MVCITYNLHKILYRSVHVAHMGCRFLGCRQVVILALVLFCIWLSFICNVICMLVVIILLQNCNIASNMFSYQNLPHFHHCTIVYICVNFLMFPFTTKDIYNIQELFVSFIFPNIICYLFYNFFLYTVFVLPYCYLTLMFYDYICAFLFYAFVMLTLFTLIVLSFCLSNSKIMRQYNPSESFDKYE